MLLIQKRNSKIYLSKIIVVNAKVQDNFYFFDNNRRNDINSLAMLVFFGELHLHFLGG